MQLRELDQLLLLAQLLLEVRDALPRVRELLAHRLLVVRLVEQFFVHDFDVFLRDSEE